MGEGTCHGSISIPTDKKGLSLYTHAARAVPNNKISGGKVIRRAVMPGQVWLKNLLRHSAASLARSESVLGDYYRRMRARMGPAGANTVVAHKLARILWHMVTHQVEYDETILAHLDEGREERRLKRLQRQARALNLQLTPLQQAA